MHALYLFWASTGDLKSILEGFNCWASENCDENNWHTMLVAVNSEGDYLILSEERRSEAEDILKTRYPLDNPTPAELACRIHNIATVRDLKKLAWFCTFSDVVFYAPDCVRKDLEAAFHRDVVVNMTLEELNKYFRAVMLKAVRKMYRYWSEQPLDSFYRMKLVWILEKIVQSMHPPFVDDGTPYNARAFNLEWYTGGHEDGGESILVADIHT